jgi:hypothetical protein
LFPRPVSGIGRYRAIICKVAEEFSPDIVLSISDVYHLLAGDWLARKFNLAHSVLPGDCQLRLIYRCQ